jgi:hypothetical protein
MDPMTMNFVAAINQASSVTMWTLVAITSCGAVALLAAVGCLITRAYSDGRAAPMARGTARSELTPT